MRQGRHAVERWQRDRLIRRVLILEGSVNAFILLAKTVVGLSTGSLAVLSDAIHSLTDLCNNVVALVVVRYASVPADREHPYGHRKFETLAVFGLATLLTVLAFEIAWRAMERGGSRITQTGWELVIMLGVLGVNIALALWEGCWARRLASSILQADAHHTMADVLTTVGVIVGWQFAARGYLWLDTVFALGIATLVLVLAYGLFKRVVPVLVDRMAAEPDTLAEAVRAVPGVSKVRRIRSHWAGAAPAVDLIITVAPELPTVEAHAIADAIEAILHKRFSINDVTVHIEPDAPLSQEPHGRQHHDQST